jgi:hypothetical protein
VNNRLYHVPVSVIPDSIHIPGDRRVLLTQTQQAGGCPAPCSNSWIPASTGMTGETGRPSRQTQPARCCVIPAKAGIQADAGQRIKTCFGLDPGFGMTVFVFLISGLIFLQGCQRSRMEELKSNLQKLEIRLNDAHAKIETLESNNNSLKQDLENANFESENLQIQNKETNEWIEDTIKNLGPCVWSGGRFERPMPHEIVKNGTPKDLIVKLNRIFKRAHSPEATLVKVEDKTAFVKIREDLKLTQEMGTTGAANYINSIVYTLFSVKGIQCVTLDFKAGDHAVPGTFCPGQDYKNEKRTKHAA